MTDLPSLIRRLEQSEGSRELDAEIVIALDLRAEWCIGVGSLWIDQTIPWPGNQPTIRVNNLAHLGDKNSTGNPPMGDYAHYTTSLDAALPGENIGCVMKNDVGWHALHNAPDGKTFEGHHPTSEPIARRIARLRGME